MPERSRLVRAVLWTCAQAVVELDGVELEVVAVFSSVLQASSCGVGNGTEACGSGDCMYTSACVRARERMHACVHACRCNVWCHRHNRCPASVQLCGTESEEGTLWR